MAELDNKINRVHLLDEIRGILIIYIVWYHLMFDLTEVFGLNIAWVYSDTMEYVRIAAVCMFILISGISCNYSKSNVNRGIKTFLWGVVITFVTLLVMPEQIIIFGILHFFGLAMIIGGLLFDKIKKIPAKTGIIISFILFLLTYNLFNGYIGMFGYEIALPQFLTNKYFLFPIGFKCEGIFSADYYPIFPWIFMFFLGIFTGRLIKQNKAPVFFYKSHYKPLAKIGQKTLLIYLIHQPILVLILYLYFSIK
ncbi:MAG: DUF1624 domain-containing protein [Eubacteriaceae bacterium]|nr:DUF1624 domain-containing protein [Eubacteriaceae bacterium]